MTVREHVPLSSLTTLKVGGEARYVLECADANDVRDAVAFLHERELPWYVLGEGSNVCASDAGYEGGVIRLTDATLTFAESKGSVAICGAGVHWDTLVTEAVNRDLWGIENLAAIPGTIGAAPVQNIGAYGAELADTLLWLEVVNAKTGELQRLSREECAFGYRDSRFKRENNLLIIVRVAIQLQPEGTPNIGYPDLVRLVEEERELHTPQQIATAVREVRSRKFPSLVEFGTAGSFFKNPVITEEAYTKLSERYPGIPGFPQAHGVKIPLAWILDNVLSLRGFAIGPVRLFERQPLVLVTDASATAHDVDILAAHVTERVLDATGITIEREVRTLK